MKLKLRYVLAAAFVLIATVPVVFLGIWVERTAFEKEVAAVQEKHLLLARNLTLALERYAQDTEAAFRMFGRQAIRGEALETLQPLVLQLGFRHFCVIDETGVVKQLVSATGERIERMSPAVVDRLKPLVGDQVAFSNVMADGAGRPTIFMVRRLGPDRLGIGALATDYMVRLQKAIAFGRRGHSAVVDAHGNTIAHPSAEWQSTMKNIAALDPVRRMVAGEAGVSRFYSPVMKGDMIAGFATVRGPGWGVMVPQPMEELEERARDVQVLALVIIIVGLAAATLLGWLLAGWLATPVAAVATAARSIAGGNLEARAPLRRAYLPSEMGVLADGFNAMAAQIQQDQQAMQEAVRAAQMADRAKTEFLANVSHELKTPLNAIIGFSEIIRDEMLGPVGKAQYKTYAGDIHTSGGRLLGVINDILDIARIQTGKMELREEKVDVVALIDSCARLIGERAAEAGLRLTAEVAPGIAAVRADERALKQALLNLLSNAVKFTRRGGELRLSAQPDRDGGVRFQVGDTGIGIAASDIPKVLSPFGQADGTLSREYEGVGLGLPLARALAELHGGDLAVRSTLGAGTTVTVSLPPERSIVRASAAAAS